MNADDLCGRVFPLPDDPVSAWLDFNAPMLLVRQGGRFAHDQYRLVTAEQVADRRIHAVVVTGDFTLHGVTMPKGSRVLLLTGAANHDEREYEDPDEFRIGRRRRRILRRWRRRLVETCKIWHNFGI